MNQTNQEQEQVVVEATTVEVVEQPKKGIKGFLGEKTQAAKAGVNNFLDKPHTVRGALKKSKYVLGVVVIGGVAYTVKKKFFGKDSEEVELEAIEDDSIYNEVVEASEENVDASEEVLTFEM